MATSSSTSTRGREVYRKWLALARPAAGALRRPLWIFRQVKPAREAYLLPDDEQTKLARKAAARGRSLSALDMATTLDWSPEDVWGPPSFPH